MTLTEIKKELYKQSPTATFNQATKSGLWYCSTIDVPDFPENDPMITFLVPFDDIEDAVFTTYMPAKHLIPYIVMPQQT